MTFKKRTKVWFTQPGKEALPAIIKDIKDEVYSLYVFYDGYWQDDMATIDMLQIREIDLSPYLYEIRKNILEQDDDTRI